MAAATRREGMAVVGVAEAGEAGEVEEGRWVMRSREV